MFSRTEKRYGEFGMHIDMTPILCGDTDKIELDYELELPEELWVSGCTFGEPIKVVGNIVNNAGYMCLTVRADVHFETECARCLAPLKRSISLDFSRTVAKGDSVENRDNDDYLLIEEGKLDLDTPLAEQIYIEMPFRYLCREDCRGICRKCGKDLNDGDCGCVQQEIDPRLEAIAKWFESDNEDNK